MQGEDGAPRRYRTVGPCPTLGRVRYPASMFGLGSTVSVDFVPDEDARRFVAQTYDRVAGALARAAQESFPAGDPVEAPRDLDGLFELVCATQARIGQEDVEFALVEMPAEGPPVPPGYAPLGNPEGQLLHTFEKDGAYLMLLAPALLRVPQLALASAARELGRLALHHAGAETTSDPELVEAEAEIAATALGLGPWVANGAYIFENACCGGGCGLDLSGIRAGLSMPEACYALALFAHRRDLPRRKVARTLAPTQKAAFKASYRHVARHGTPPPDAGGATAPDANSTTAA